MPAFKLGGKPLAYYGAWQHHIGFYPTPSGMKKYQTELSAFVTAKGSAQFPHTIPLPIDLIVKIIKFRANEIQSKT